MRSVWRSEVLRRLRAAKLDPATEQEVVEELAQHLDDCYRELLATGMPEAQARRAVLKELDNKGLGRSIGELKSEPRSPSNLIEPDRTPSNLFEPLRTLSNLLLDVRFAFRLMRRSPGFTTVAAATMAVCIGATVALFSVVDTLLLRPLDYPRAERLVRVFEHIVDANLLRNQVSGPNVLDWKRESTAFESIAAYRRRNVNVSAYGAAAAGAGEPRYVKAARASVEFFGVLGVSPALGRVFTIEEDRQAAHVTIVSHAFWKSHLASDPDVVSKSLDFDGEPYVVIGVLPERFRFQLEADAWIPLGLYPGTRAGRGAHNLNVLGRLKEGASVSRAQAELESSSKRLAREYPETNAR
jgi:putative ABC transport system permease protein